MVEAHQISASQVVSKLDIQVIHQVGGWSHVDNHATLWPNLQVETCKLELNLSLVPSLATVGKNRDTIPISRNFNKMTFNFFKQ